MVLGFGVVHPKGEVDAHYEGLFFRSDETEELARSLKGKPLLLDHDKSNGAVGVVEKAWVGKGGEVFALFRTHDTLSGHVASSLMKHNVCRDLSLGHDVVVVRDGDERRVIGKIPREVSICVQGDRDGTHIHAVQSSSAATRRLKIGSIYASRAALEATVPSKRTTPSPHKRRENMSQTTNDQPKTTKKNDADEDDSTTKAVDEGAAPTADEPVLKASNLTEGDTFKEELLNLVTKQQAENAVLLERIKSETAGRHAAEDKARKLDEGNKRKRAAILNGAVAEMLKTLMEDEEFKTKLAGQEGAINNLLEGMKESDGDTVDPLVDVMSCAASRIARSTTQLEREFQASKRLKTERDQLRSQLDNLRKPALQSARERFGAPSNAAAPTSRVEPTKPEWTRVMPPGMREVEKNTSGMQVRNPSFWSSLNLDRAQGNTGMGWMRSKGIVGKEYFTDGRQPKLLPHE